MMQPCPWVWQGPQLGGEGAGEGGSGGGEWVHWTHAAQSDQPHRCSHVCVCPVFCETEFGHQDLHKLGGGEGEGGGGEGSGGGLGGGDGKVYVHFAIIPGPMHCSGLPVPHSSWHVMGHEAQLSSKLLHGGGEGEGGGGSGGGGGNGSGETSGGDGLGGGGQGGGLGALPGGHGGGGGLGRALQLPMLKGGMPMFTKTEGGK